MKRSALAVIAVLLCVVLWLWQRGGSDSSLAPGETSQPVGLKIAGGDGGGLPRALPVDEKLDEQALNRVVALADVSGTSVFLVARHGHLLIEHYATNDKAAALLDGGGMTAAVLALAEGDAKLISSRLWQPLNAHDAWLNGCCLRARPIDWLRLGILLAQEGRFEGGDVVPTNVITRLRTAGAALESGNKASGAEPFAARDVYYLRGNERTRLWIAPSMQIVALQMAGPAGANGWDETQLFNQVLRAATDRTTTASAGDLLNQLVPGH
jgi:hypothetical protein